MLNILRISYFLIIYSLLVGGAPALSQIDEFVFRNAATTESVVCSDKMCTEKMTINLVEGASYQEVNKLIAIAEQHTNFDKLIVSTDSQALLGSQLNNRFNRIKSKVLLPMKDIGEKLYSSMIKKPKKYIEHLIQAAKNDRMGLMVLTVTTAYDSYIWIHATQFSLEQRSAMIALNLSMAIAFNIDKDIWPKMTRVVELRMTNVLMGLSQQEGNFSWKKKLTSYFLANTALSIGIQTVRSSILSFDHLANSVTSLPFWGTSFFLGAALSFSTFGWGEHLANIDQLKSPTAKTLARRLFEIRALMMGYTANSGKLLQPNEYGFLPWVALIGHGALGLAAWIYGEKVVDAVENNQTIKFIKNKYRRLSSSRPSFIEKWRKNNSLCLRLITQDDL